MYCFYFLMMLNMYFNQFLTSFHKIIWCVSDVKNKKELSVIKECVGLACRPTPLLIWNTLNRNRAAVWSWKGFLPEWNITCSDVHPWTGARILQICIPSMCDFSTDVESRPRRESNEYKGLRKAGRRDLTFPVLFCFTTWRKRSGSAEVFFLLAFSFSGQLKVRAPLSPGS